MVKSKFPGKPSKLVQRTLVSAYSIAVPACDTSAITENVCYGLSVFENFFGSDEVTTGFVGFGDEEIEKSRKKSVKFRASVEENFSFCRNTNISPMQPTVYKSIVAEPANFEPSVTDLQSDQWCASKPTKKEQKKCNKVWFISKKMVNRYHSKLVLRHSFKALKKSSLIRFKHKPLASNYLTEKYCRRFNLPSRSLHSSRVIKPNKRFGDNNERNSKININGKEDNNEKSKSEIIPGKVIIREARLNITTEQPITGPFSVKKSIPLDKDKLRSGFIDCGVCGVIRYYKYVIQTRKFGIYSCESCRRFMLKMIKHSKLSTADVLECKAENGIGKCVISTEDTQNDATTKTNRCDACWLNLCLQRYILSRTLQKSLIRLIPKDLNMFPRVDHLAGPNSLQLNDDFHAKLNKRLSTNINYPLKAVKSSKRIIERHDSSGSIKSRSVHVKKSIRSHRLRLKNENSEILRKENVVEGEHYMPRGPRIKHVCRSASSVLRTPLEADDTINSPGLEPGRLFRRSSGNSDGKPERQVNMNKIRHCSDAESQIETDLTNHQRARSLQDFTKDSSDDYDSTEEKLISTDFWEAYDPDKIFKVGFPLITSEPMNVRALCFLCGSAGIDKLLYCVACCEPYHWYCAEGPSAFREEAELEKFKVNWVCRKCKVCTTCGKSSSLGNLTSCKRCRNSYHSECLSSKAQNKRLFKSDRPWVCPSCLKCKSCNSGSVFTHVGNIPLCSQCFKLRQKGNYCPLCQGCYQDEDYNVPMMECGMCKCWIHSKCEGISYEKYQILSFLPDSIEFVCRLCCSRPPPQWCVAVEDELKAGFYGILKCLCKNKTIGDLLKESPRKENNCSCSIEQNVDYETGRKTYCETVNVKRALSFDLEDTVESRNRSESSDDINSTNAEKIRCSFCHHNLRMRNKMSQRLLAIKVNVRNNSYTSVSAFHQELESVLLEVEDEFDLMDVYGEILRQFFPWFDPNHVQLEEVTQNFVEAVSNENASISDNDEFNLTDTDDYTALRKLMAIDEYVYESHRMLDVRKCNLCKGMGEAVPSEGGRLIYCGRNEWVHSNCALWSSEVFEEIDGSLQNVHSAISRGRQIRCLVCDKKGASVGCCFKNCTLTYHFMCAKKANCIFMQNKTIYCCNHDLRQLNLQSLVDEKDFEIFRPVYIEMDRRKKKFEWHTNVRLRIGSLHVESLGKIDPHLSDNSLHILPIYFRCTRLFWSMRKPWKIIQYHIQIKVSYSYQSSAEESELNYTVDHSIDRQRKGGNDRVHQVADEIVDKVVKSKRIVFPAVHHDPLDASKSMVENCHFEKKLDCTEPNQSVRVNGKCLRDKNYFKEDARQIDGFDNNCAKVKRKIDSENSTFNTKKKTRENGYISAAKLNHIVVDCYKAYEKIMQVDGMVDIYTDDEPVTCNQCNRTYRTTMSYERHLDTCNTDFGDFMISSCESDSMSSEEEKLSYAGANNAKIVSFESSPMGEVKLPTAAHPVCDVAFTAKYANTYIIENNDKLSTQSYINNSAANIDLSSLVYPYSTMTYDNGLLNSGYTMVPNLKDVNLAPQQILPVNDQTIKLNIMGNDCKITNYSQIVTTQPQTYSLHTSPATYVIQPQQQQQPTYVTIDGSMAHAEALLTSQSVQPLYQPIMTNTSVNFQPVIPMISTIMQPNVIETPVSTAYIVNPSNPTHVTDLFTSQNNLIIPSQPLMFGLETMMSNTVMSSSHQFLGQSLSGVNMESSTLYSSTTTQVFQGAKQLPQQPDFSSGFFVVNTPVAQTLQVQQPKNVVTTPRVRQVARIEPKVVPQLRNTPEKIMCVPVTPMPRKAQSVTVKPAAKQGAPAKKVVTKVMKVKNNRPVAIHTVNNAAVHMIADNAKNSAANTKNLQIRTTNAAVLCRTNSQTTSFPRKYQECDSMKMLSRPQLVAEVAPSVRLHKAVDVKNSMTKKTDSVPPMSIKIDNFSISIPKLSPELIERQLNEKADSVVSAVSTTSPSFGIKDFSVKLPPLNYKLNESETNKKADPVPPISIRSFEVNNFSIKIPTLKSHLIENQENIRTEMETVTEPPQISSMSMPLLDNPVQAVNENDRIFDELLRQHKLSIKNPEKENKVSVSKDRAEPVAPKDEGLQTNVEPNVPSSAATTKPSSYLLNSAQPLGPADQVTVTVKKPPNKEAAESSCNIVTKRMKYKPRIINRKDTKEAAATATSTTHTPDLKGNTKKAKKSPDKEKENIIKEPAAKVEKNSWKTASISYEVNAEDGFTYKTNNLLDLWTKILDSVQQSRADHKLPLLPKNALMDAESVYGLLGFENNASKYLLEQLPDAWKCIFYKPVFHKSPVYGKASVTENMSGCARTEPFNSSHKYDMFGWLASRHRKPPKFIMMSDSDIVNGNRRITSLNLPMAMRFRHLKETAKETVGVFRSDIHGRGLFCLRDIDASEMVIEYAGEVVRSTLTDKREKYYTSKGIGCYMFRIDDKYVVDATICGNAARFINHSCDPNCYSRIVDILGKKHIIIFALRRIPKGEELTYDYKFPLEEDKIHCHCLARKCRKYLN